MYKGQVPDNNLTDWSAKSDVTREIMFSLGLYFLIQQAVTSVPAYNANPVDISALFALAVQLQKQLGTLGDCIRRTLRYWAKGCRVPDLLQLMFQTLLTSAHVKEKWNFSTSDAFAVLRTS